MKNWTDFRKTMGNQCRGSALGYRNFYFSLKLLCSFAIL